jgi:hypothetical protein
MLSSRLTAFQRPRAGVHRQTLLPFGWLLAGRHTGRFCGIVCAMRDLAWTALPLGIVLAVAGCGSGDAAKGEGGVASCPPASGGLGTMSWLDDGTLACAVSALATFDSTSTVTLFSLTGATTKVGLGLGVTSTLGPAAVGGTYSCAGNDPGIDVTLNYTQGVANNTFAEACEITLNIQGMAGFHVTGTSSATLMPAAGGTKSITKGVFDAPVTIVGGS